MGRICLLISVHSFDPSSPVQSEVLKYEGASYFWSGMSLGSTFTLNQQVYFLQHISVQYSSCRTLCKKREPNTLLSDTSQKDVDNRIVFVIPTTIHGCLLPDHLNVISINPLKTNRRQLYLKIQSVPRCKHFSSRL